MKKLITGAAVVALAALGAIALPTAALATDCVPQDAWTETVEHPAIGDEMIPNPDYVEATEAVTEIVHHDAVTVDHEAVTATQYKYATLSGKVIWLDNKDQHSFWKGAHLFFLTSHTQQVTVTEAWTETVTEAYDEEIIVTEAQPAQGEPTIANPDYVAPRTETIEHAAVECDPVDVANVEVWWLVPAGAELLPSDSPMGDGYRVDADGFPQTLISGASDIPCEQYAQVDMYPADQADAITEDGILTNGEDHAAVQSWRFVYGGDCEVVVPPVDEEPEVPTETPETPDVTPVVKVTTPIVPAMVDTAAPAELAVTGLPEQAALALWLPLGLRATLLGLILTLGSRLRRTTN